MTPQHAEPARFDPNCEIRAGNASWNDADKSIKYCWFDKNGRACRGGEFPVEVVPQMLEFLIRHGYLKLAII